MKKLINFRFAIKLALSLITGILISYYFLCGNFAIGISLFAIFIALLILYLVYSIYKNKLKTAIAFISVFIIIALVGAGLFLIKTTSFNSANVVEKEYSVSARICEISNTSSGKYCVLDSVCLNEKANPYKISLYVTGEVDLDVGDNIEFTSIIKNRSLFFENNFSAYDVANGKKYTAYINSDSISINGKSLTVFESVNVTFRDAFIKGMDEDSFPIAYALMCGNAEFIEEDVISSYRNAGIAHIFAVSGLHIGFMAGILSFILTKCRCNKYLTAIMVVIATLFYSGVCGFSASSIRATVMCTIMFVSKLMHRKYDGLSSLGLSAVVVLLINPIQLFCAGFQLSFIVVLGILVLPTTFNKVFSFLPKKLASSVSVCLSAFIFSVPISLLCFGEVSIIAIMFNLIFLPLVGIIYTLNFTMLILSLIFSCPQILLFLPNYIFKGVNFVVTFLDYNVFIFGGISVGVFGLIYYFTFFVLAGTFNLKAKIRVILSCILALITILGSVLLTVDKNNSVNAYAIGNSAICATYVTSREESILIFNSVSDNFSISRIVRVKNQSYRKKLDTVVFAESSNPYDIQRTLTLLMAEFEIDRVIKYGAYDIDELSMLNAVFKNVEFASVISGDNTVLKNFTIDFHAEGYAVSIGYGNNKILAVSQMEENAVYGSIPKDDYKLLVVSDYVGEISSLLEIDNVVCYRDTASYPNAENSGNFLYKFN